MLRNLKKKIQANPTMFLEKMGKVKDKKISEMLRDKLSKKAQILTGETSQRIRFMEEMIKPSHRIRRS